MKIISIFLLCFTIYAEDIVKWECPKSMRYIYRTETGQLLWQLWEVKAGKCQWVDRQ